MTDVSTFRLYLLRAAYLVMGVGLALSVWPNLLSHTPDWAHAHGTAAGLFAGMSVIALLGLRYPLKMLPMLMFELVWKFIYLLAVSLPLWRAGQMDADMWYNAKACLAAMIVMPIVIPWPYVFTHYVKAPAERWR